MTKQSVLEQQRLYQRLDNLRESVSIGDLLRLLGADYDEQSNRRILCIFPDHPERNPAMQVFPDQGKVHCFACGKGGDVIEVARRAAGGDGKIWSLDHTADWLEEQFSVTPPAPAKSLAKQLSQRLDRWRKVKTDTAAQYVSQEVAEQTIARLLDDTQAAFPPHIRAAVAGTEDYIWAEFERRPIDYGQWTSWATLLIQQFYTKELQELHSTLSTDLSPENAPGADVPIQDALE